jgi:adenine deaminase
MSQEPSDGGRTRRAPRREQAVALGADSADLVIENGRVLLTDLGEFRDRDVAVVGDRIAAVPDDASGVVDDDTTVVDAAGRAVVPGFVDAHTHAEVFQTIETAYHRLLEGGSTTLITEAAAFGAVHGADGIRELLDASADLPVDLRATVPPQPFFDTFGEPADEAIRAETVALLDAERVVGVGESDWVHVVGRDSPAGALYERANELGLRVVGHGAGCADEKLTAYAAVVDNDHEAITADEVTERLERGIHPVGRSGAIRDDSEAIAAAVTRHDAEASLSTDGVWPDALATGDAMNAAVRRVIDHGVDPVTAVQMATLAPARHFGLTDRGAVAPGNVADLLVLDDLESVTVGAVVADGDIVVRNGEATVGPRERDYPDEYYDTVSVDPSPGTFQVPESAACDGAARALEYRHGLVTTETTVRPGVDGDSLVADPDRDVAKATLLDRRNGVDDAFTGFLTGLGIDTGAIATSLTWEQPAVAVVGVNDAAMARAVSRIAEMGGGFAAVRDGDVVADLPLPVAGVATDTPVTETAESMEAVRAAFRSVGVDVERPLLPVQTVSFFGVPSLKLTPRGYADIFARSVVGLTPAPENAE